MLRLLVPRRPDQTLEGDYNILRHRILRGLILECYLIAATYVSARLLDARVFPWAFSTLDTGQSEILDTRKTQQLTGFGLSV